ncbi:MAG: SpoIIE family protein phosphatase [Spirochaetia bacterium]|nr:SpoIIE family protein phosphatase [Spirochaetia bacterium]
MVAVMLRGKLLLRLFPALREMEPAVYREDLRKSMHAVLPWADLVTDSALHPEHKQALIYLRLSLTVAGAIIVTVSMIPALRKHSIFWANFLAAVLQTATPLLTNVVQNDPRYVAGYLLALVLMALFPLPFFHMLAWLTWSVVQYFVVAAVYNTGIFASEQEYSRNNVILAYFVTIIMMYVNERARMRAKVRELKLDKKTVELAESLDEVRALKTKQDGDYFLTSLLIKPLGGNFSSSNAADVDVMVRQKTHFRFQKWYVEIGGDLAAVHSIRLRGRPYLVFVNADAMGKSIQGAGGALVFGTVFKSVITRTQLSSRIQERYPEHWIRELLQDLQTVFVSFDGSMLVSAVVGLIDEDSGTLYYASAEHPPLVLLRDGRSTFIENESSMMKIGVEGFEEQLAIGVTTLHAGDVLVAGSDGRDDLGLQDDHAGNRVINENEKLILDVVTRSQGKLPEMERLLKESGELTDDLSLISINMRTGAPHAPAHPDHARLIEEARLAGSDLARAKTLLEEALNLGESAEVVAELARVLFRLKDYAAAARLGERYSEMVPSSLEFLYATSVALKHTGEITRAIDFGERVRLRKPGLTKNLINLGDCYVRAKNFARAEELAALAYKQDPDNAKVHKLMSALESMPGKPG